MQEHRDIGFIKLKRTILEWEWYQDNSTFRIMIHLLLKANYTVKKWQGNTIEVGELITSIGNLAKELKLSDNVIRTGLSKLKTTNYITTHSTNRFTKIKVLKSIIYEETNLGINKLSNHQITNQSQSNNNQLTTTKKVKKEEENKESKEVFKNEIYQFSNLYSQEHLKGFYEYWSTVNNKTERRRFEETNYWNLENQLNSWKVFNSKNKTQTFKINR